MNRSNINRISLRKRGDKEIEKKMWNNDKSLIAAQKPY